MHVYTHAVIIVITVSTCSDNSSCCRHHRLNIPDKVTIRSEVISASSCELI